MNKTVTKEQKKKRFKLLTAGKCSGPPFVDKIPLIRTLILESVKPGTIKKIYLFGSYAYGKPTEDSDIDLCVIIRNNLDRSKIYLEIARNLFLNDIIPADILVYKEEIFYDIKNPNGIENTILTKGKILYG